jgi:hypothetical protein
MRIALLSLFAAGCVSGPNPDTLISDLRVVAAVVDPPTVAPGQTADVTITVADPEQLSPEVSVWSCMADECQVERGNLDQGQFKTTVVGQAPTVLWALACMPGLCDPTEPDLLNPPEFLSEIPMSQASLASRTLLVDEDADGLNPTIEESPSPDLTSGPGESLTLDFTVPAATTAWTYTTRGGFESTSVELASDGQTTVTWFAPAEAPISADLYVVFKDDEGGVALWQGSVR